MKLLSCGSIFSDTISLTFALCSTLLLSFSSVYLSNTSGALWNNEFLQKYTGTLCHPWETHYSRSRWWTIVLWQHQYWQQYKQIIKGCLKQAGTFYIYFAETTHNVCHEMVTCEIKVVSLSSLSSDNWRVASYYNSNKTTFFVSTKIYVSVK